MYSVSNQFHNRACGKLLLSGEYFVLQGAKAFALPTKKGQSIEVKPYQKSFIKWTSTLHTSEVWFSCILNIDNNFKPDLQSQEADMLSRIFQEALKLNPQLNFNYGFEVRTQLEFDKSWGLGSSSTLIVLIANWLDIDAYSLLQNTFGGSGYDIAVGLESRSILYTLKHAPSIEPIDFNPSFSDSLYFFYLNKKQNSREAIEHFRKQTIENSTIDRVSEISRLLSVCGTLDEFSFLLKEHEDIVSKNLHLPKVSELMPSIPSSIQLKSLGAWGGDFVLAATSIHKNELLEILNKQGINTLISFNEMIYNHTTL